MPPPTLPPISRWRVPVLTDEHFWPLLQQLRHELAAARSPRARTAIRRELRQLVGDFAPLLCASLSAEVVPGTNGVALDLDGGPHRKGGNGSGVNAR